jgi:hypothetical protein
MPGGLVRAPLLKAVRIFGPGETHMHRSASLALVLLLSVACHGGSTPPSCPGVAAEVSGGETSTTTVEEDIRELIRVTHATELTKQMLGPMMDALAKAYPQVPAEFWSEMAAATSSEEFEAMIIDVYKQNLSHADIRAMLAFNRSEAGQRVIAQMPAIMGASQAAGQRWGASIAENYLREARHRGYKL